MKKIISVIVAVLLVACMSVSAFATSPISSVPGTDTKDVHVTIGSGTGLKVYKVVIEWASLDFTYNPGTDASWNPETHEYSDGTGAGWDGETTRNVKVTNHSNAAVNVAAAIDTATKNGVTVALGNASFQLATAVGTTVAAAPNDTFTVSVSGAPNPVNDFTVGTVTVTVSAPTA